MRRNPKICSSEQCFFPGFYQVMLCKHCHKKKKQQEVKYCGRALWHWFSLKFWWSRRDFPELQKWPEFTRIGWICGTHISQSWSEWYFLLSNGKRHFLCNYKFIWIHFFYTTLLDTTRTYIHKTLNTALHARHRCHMPSVKRLRWKHTHKPRPRPPNALTLL